jgi:phosphatidylglycerophosphate synthase
MPGPEVTAATRVAGLSLVSRLLRMSARQTWAGAVVLVDDAGRAAVEAAIAREPAPEGFTVELAAAPPAPAGRTFIELDGRALYAAGELEEAARAGRRPAPILEVRTRADVRAGRRRLFRALKKSVELDGVVSYYVMRALSGQLTRVLLDTPVSPNQVTLVVLVSGLVQAFVAAGGGYWAGAIAGLIFWFGCVVDCVDGELARLRLKGSRIGEWLDSIADEITLYGLMAGLGVGLAREGAGDGWAVLGLAGAAGGLVVKALMYRDLHRARRPIDTAQYPWFFGDPSRPASERSRSPLSRLWYVIEYGFRRDGICTISMLLLLAGQREATLLVLALGGLAVAPVLLVHYAVTAARRART